MMEEDGAGEDKSKEPCPGRECVECDSRSMFGKMEKLLGPWGKNPLSLCGGCNNNHHNQKVLYDSTYSVVFCMTA